MILIPTVVIMGISSAIHYHSEQEDALATMSLLASQTGEVIERAIEHDMLESDFDHIQRIFNDIGEDPRIGALYLLDLNGRVVFSPGQDRVEEVLSDQAVSCQPCHSRPVGERPLGIVTSVQDGQRFFRSMHPIENQPACHQCHDSQQAIIGVLLTDFSIEPINQKLAADLRGNLIWWAVTILVMIILVNFTIQRWVVNRIDNLHSAIDGFGRTPQPEALPEGPQDEIGRLSHTFNIMADRVSNRDAENQALSEALKQRINERGQLLKKIITTQEEERVRVARELHDELGQSLGSTAIQIEMAKRQLPPELEEPMAHLNQANHILKTATDQMYDLISGLRPSVLDDLGLEAAFRSLAKLMLEPAGVSVNIDCSGLIDRLPGELEIVIYRVFQEAFTNVLRHARATEVSLKIWVEDDYVHGDIADNGKGFDPDRPPETNGRSSGLGLVGMRERIGQFDGEFNFVTKPGEGTRIHVALPIVGALDE
jgi:signal transduction histidine kinase